LPAIAKAKAAAHKTVCVNNLKQINTAATMYSADYSEKFVGNNQGDANAIGANGRVQLSWVRGSFEGSLFDNTNVLMLINESQSLLAPYIKDFHIYKCPADREKVQIVGSTVSGQKDTVRSYGMNSMVGWNQRDDYRNNPTPGYRRFLGLGDVTGISPSDILMFIDMNPRSLCRPFFGIDMANRFNFYHMPAAHHNRSGVNSFVDGSVSPHRWIDKDTVNPANVDHGHAFTDPGNVDAGWIKDHGSVRR
jgi:hypothetical protein